MTHICISKLTIIGSDNEVSPGWQTNAGILLIGLLGTNVNEISNDIGIFSFKKKHLKMLSGKWRPILSRPQCFNIRLTDNLVAGTPRLSFQDPYHSYTTTVLTSFTDIMSHHICDECKVGNGKLQQQSISVWYFMIHRCNNFKYDVLESGNIIVRWKSGSIPTNKIVTIKLIPNPICTLFLKPTEAQKKYICGEYGWSPH